MQDCCRPAHIVVHVQGAGQHNGKASSTNTNVHVAYMVIDPVPHQRKGAEPAAGTAVVPIVTGARVGCVDTGAMVAA